MKELKIEYRNDAKKSKTKRKQLEVYFNIQYTPLEILSAMSMKLGEMGNEMNLLTRSSDSLIQ